MNPFELMSVSEKTTARRALGPVDPGQARGSAGIREKYSRIRFKFLMLRAFLLHTPLRPRSGLLALRVETE